MLIAHHGERVIRLSKLVNINSIRQRHHFLLKKSTLRLHTIVGLADFFVSV